MQEFDVASYQAQVQRLRKLATGVLERYPLAVDGIHFLNHGENTTFRVETKNRGRLLLRIHRNGYHTTAAIEDELRWLEHLSQNRGLIVPKPVQSKRGAWVEMGTAAGVPFPRNCTMLQWVDGRFSRRLLTPQQVFALGKAIADLHGRDSQRSLPRRRYWNAKGIIGARPKLGPVTALVDATPRQQRTIDEARRLIYKRLSDYEKRFPERLGTVHADVHFGNVVFSGDSPRLIDFDDCGLGFYEYDIAVPLISLKDRASRNLISSYETYRDALISGYAVGGKWSNQSDRVLPYVMAARRVAMLGWMQSRTDHPGLRAYLRDTIPRTALELQQDLL